jgi:hypothetical protein
MEPTHSRELSRPANACSQSACRYIHVHVDFTSARSRLENASRSPKPLHSKNHLIRIPGQLYYRWAIVVYILHPVICTIGKHTNTVYPERTAFIFQAAAAKRTGNNHVSSKSLRHNRSLRERKGKKKEKKATSPMPTVVILSPKKVRTQAMYDRRRSNKEERKKPAPKQHPHHPALTHSLTSLTSKRLALQALLARLTSTHRLPPHSAVSSSSSSLLRRIGRRALRTHRPGPSERVAAAGATDVDHAGRSQLGSDGGLGGGELEACCVSFWTGWVSISAWGWEF